MEIYVFACKPILGQRIVTRGHFYNRSFNESTMRWADGEVEVGMYRAGAHVGEGFRLAPHWKAPKRLQDGMIKDIITVEDARKIAARIGVPMPALRSRVQP